MHGVRRTYLPNIFPQRVIGLIVSRIVINTLAGSGSESFAYLALALQTRETVFDLYPEK